jgi:hypothetical protein
VGATDSSCLLEKAFAMQPIRFAPLFFTLVCLCPQAANAQDDLSFEPYTVYVVEQKSHTRCGPSEDYYRTDPLRHGQALEVYAETDDGWLGIRPPDDSFCWVQAETIEFDDTTDIGTVVEDRTVAWIGTHLGRARSYRWQVQMAKGEEVTVIGKSEREGPDGPQLWYKIVPPSGEYRWVRRDQVVDSSEKLVEAAQRAKERAVAQQSRAQQRQTQQSKTPRSAKSDDQYAEKSDANATTGSGIARRNDRTAEPSLATADGASTLQPAPQPGSNSLAEAGQQWQSNDNRLAVDNAIAANQQTNVQQQAVPSATTADTTNAEVSFIGRPKLLEIGTRATAPQRSVAAGDANWVIGTTPRPAVSPPATGTPVAAATLSNPIAQVAGQAAIHPQSFAPATMATRRPVRVVSPERIAQIEAETQNADIERLDLIFSRLMAAQASSAEINPIARAARRLSTSVSDPTTAGRARMLSERTEQYRRIADRRDGQAVVGQSASLQFPSPSLNVAPVAGTSVSSGPGLNAVPNGAVSTVPGQSANETALVGFLVQVYSARSDSPPFALTDNTGRTIAYVTPTPGTNLRVHLNSKVRVAGGQGYLTGLNTPHIVATTVTRTAE